MVGEGLSTYLADTERLRNTAILVSAMALGVYTTKTGAGVAGRYLEARLGKPSLVRETSRLPVSSVVKHPISTAKRVFGKANAQDTMKGIVLEESLDTQLRKIAVSTSHTKANKAPFRHLLLHGPPGTGKTLFARNLAHHSGLDFAVFTGGDIAPLGRDAVTELHKLFDWAHTSRRGLLLFVDEADAFLQSRNKKTDISEDQRNALNAFLYRTGTETDKFMMVYASNQPSQFDEAVTDRIDEMVEFGLPALDERRRMIAMYMDQYLLNPTSRAQKKVKVHDDINEEVIESVVQSPVGFSGRAISKLVIAWQASAYGSVDGSLTKETFLETLEHHKNIMLIKEEWAEAITRST